MTFDQVGSTDWVVPANVCSVTIDAAGAQAGARRTTACPTTCPVGSAAVSWAPSR